MSTSQTALKDLIIDVKTWDLVQEAFEQHIKANFDVAGAILSRRAELKFKMPVKREIAFANPLEKTPVEINEEISCNALFKASIGQYARKLEDYESQKGQICTGHNSSPFQILKALS
jgi:hypothetical protein